MKIFLTGKPGSGKSTVFRKTVEILESRGITVSGIATPEVRDETGVRVGFDVVDLTTGARAVLSRAADRGVTRSSARVGRYFVDVEEFESVALPALEAAKDRGIAAIDEVGKMEFFSERFASLWAELLESDVDVLAVVGGPYLRQCRGKGEIFEVTLRNREDLPRIVAGRFRR